ncbi:MAG: hypothetical protein AAGB02_01650 [Pseudomonadota bacterium]
MGDPVRPAGNIRSVWGVVTGAGAVVIAVFATPCNAANPWALEVGTVSTNDTFSLATFTSVTFDTPFASTPVVVSLATNQGGDSSDIRIRNITATGFEIAAVEPPGNDGPHVSMAVHYIAMTPGAHILPSGQTVVAGLHTTSTVQRSGVVGGPAGFDMVPFPASLGTTSSVIAAIQTENSEENATPGAPSQPWLTVVMENPTAVSVGLALERSEVAAGTVMAETIGYIAFPDGDNGAFIDDIGTRIDWSTDTTPETIVGFSNGCTNYTYSGTSFTAPRIFAGKITRNGGDGG